MPHLKMRKFLRPESSEPFFLPLLVSYPAYDANTVGWTFKRYPECGWFHCLQCYQPPLSLLSDDRNHCATGSVASTLSPLVATQKPGWSFKIMSDHVTPLLKTLQWLPISIRVKLKPLSGSPHLPAAIPSPPIPRSLLSSSHADLLAIPWLWQEHTNPRALAVLSAWNSPPLISAWFTLIHPSWLCRNTTLPVRLHPIFPVTLSLLYSFHNIGLPLVYHSFFFPYCLYPLPFRQKF